eukprot:TRINITY_DN12791_c0_g1_i2.p1 TRINITY_DN12791_c0_g1~~TRINITY_DN12791_c0_g1_i2.p1  ORF type:complete len:268 (+),score=56.17 TRINITY_DN12791_c0_g1_i2:39-806(+)
MASMPAVSTQPVVTTTSSLALHSPLGTMSQAPSTSVSLRPHGLRRPEKEQHHQMVHINHKYDHVEVTKEVEVPQCQVHHFEEELSHPVTMEHMNITYKPQHYEVLREEMHPEWQIHTKEVTKPVYDANVRDVEVPHVVNHEQIVEVPHVQLHDLFKEVPRYQHQTVAKHVEKPVTHVAERHVEVPAVTTREVLAEVPRYEQHELMKQVPGQHTINEVRKEVAKHEIEVHHVLEELDMPEIQDHIVEVPQIETREI